MLNQARIILSLIIITLLLSGIILLSIPACTSNRDGAALPPPEGPTEVNVPKIEPREKGNPKLGSHLWDIIEAESQGEAESFASGRDNIELVDGGVRVIIECVPGQVEAAAEAATNAGAKLETSYKNWLQAVVPITSLTALAEAESIRFIRVPILPTLE